ncbi:MAG: DUF3293 domain-containing protein [Planctomycetota bacterium]|nr:DUF3293 domain-containing protein [Planctomycetota bacterium]
MAVEQPSQELLAAYQATTYTARLGASEVRIRVGARCPRLDQELADRKLSSWAYLTACNPGSQPLPIAENRERQQELRRAVGDGGWACYPGAGVPDTSTWKPEESLLILGIQRQSAVELARRFGQLAIVWGTRDAAAELLFSE